MYAGQGQSGKTVRKFRRDIARILGFIDGVRSNGGLARRQNENGNSQKGNLFHAHGVLFSAKDRPFKQKTRRTFILTVKGLIKPEFIMRNRLTIFALLSAFALSACGIKGELKTPPPVWGDEKPSAEQDDSQPDG